MLWRHAIDSLPELDPDTFEDVCLDTRKRLGFSNIEPQAVPTAAVLHLCH